MPNAFDNFYKGRRVLITGNTGFKGSWLSLWLLELGAEIVGFALKPPTSPSLFKISKLANKTTSISGDIRNLKRLKNAFKKYRPEIVFHMAAQSLVRQSYQQPVGTYQTNIMGSINMFEACRNTSSVRAIVNVTSDKCYANRERVHCYRETDPMGGYDPYSSSKGCAELITASYINSYFNPDDYKKHKLAVASARAGNVIGGGDWGQDRLVPDCIKTLLKNKPILIRYPGAVRPWQHVLEPLFGYLLLAQRLYEKGPLFSGGWNFGPDHKDVKPVKFMVERIIKKWGGKSRWLADKNVHPHEAKFLELDCAKSKSKLDWRPNWDLGSALDKTIDWYKSYYQNKEMSKVTIEQIKSYEESIAK